MILLPNIVCKVITTRFAGTYQRSGCDKQYLPERRSGSKIFAGMAFRHVPASLHPWLYARVMSITRSQFLLSQRVIMHGGPALSIVAKQWNSHITTVQKHHHQAALTDDSLVSDNECSTLCPIKTGHYWNCDSFKSSDSTPLNFRTRYLYYPHNKISIASEQSLSASSTSFSVTIATVNISNS